MFLDEMPGKFRYPQPEDAEDKALLADIQRKGWHHFAVPGGDGQPGYTFSVGHFLNLNHPELIVVGLKDALASKLLDSAAVRVRGLKRPYQPYRLYNDIADGLEVMFLPVAFPHYKEYLGFANWFYQSLPAPYPALQMVWPDPKGVFPWQPGYDSRFHRAQPLLGKAPASPLGQRQRFFDSPCRGQSVHGERENIMANSLQKQLMKAGLADEKKARKAKQQKREDVNKAKRGEIELEDPADRARRLREEKAEADRQREAERKAEREKKEIAAQIKQMIEQSRLDRNNGEVAFQFVQDKKIKKAYVTGKQQKQLERGQIAIVALGDSFELVPTVVAEKIRQRDEAAVLLLNERGNDAVDEDDPYKDFPIPDDLMW